MKVSGQENWIDKLFHKKLSDFEFIAESHVWDGIVKRLDEDKKRPGIFGHWWTVLLAVLLSLVIGIGAYLLYTKAVFTRAEKNQNRDLPFKDLKTYQDLSSNFNKDELRTVLFTPAPVGKIKNQKKENNNLSLLNALPSKVSTPFVHIYTGQELIQHSNPSFQSESTDINSTVLLSEKEESPLGNELFVSSDSNFYSENLTTAKDLSYDNLPLKESYLKMKADKLSAPLFLDGCNVYNDNRTHFFIDVYYAPEIASRSLSTEDLALQSYVDERANSEKPIISYSTGVKASIVFGSGLSVRAGLSYSKNSERFDFVKETQTLEKKIFDNEGHLLRTEYTELVIMDKTYNRYSYVDVPILLGYEKDLKDFKLSINGGIGLNLSASQSGKIYKDDEKNKMNFILLEDNGGSSGPIFRKTAGMSLIGSVGLNYKYNERVMLLLEPSARYYVRSLSDPSNPINQNYLYLGLNIGLRYRIK